MFALIYNDIRIYVRPIDTNIQMSIALLLIYIIVKKYLLQKNIHTLRHEGLLKLVMEGTTEGKGYKGIPSLQYVRQILVDVNCVTYEEMKLSLIHI